MMSERIRIGYIHEFHPNFGNNSWISYEDLTSIDPVVKKEVQHWLYGLANPWSETAISFITSPTIMVDKEIPKEKTWTAKYISTFYDCLQSIAIAYGSTPAEAIDNVTAMVKDVLEKYYVPDEDESPSPILNKDFAEILNIFLLKEGEKCESCIKNVIEKYKTNTAEIENKFNEIWNIRNFYRIRRPDYIGNTMLICSFIPFFVFILGFAIFIASENLNPVMLRWIMLGVVGFCSFIIAPVVLWREKSKFKELNYRLKDKSKDKIIADDFKNYIERLVLSVQVEINSKVINHFEAELKNLDDKEALIESLKNEYDVVAKRSTSLNNSWDKDFEIKQLSDLKQAYQEKLNQEVKKLAVVKFFSFSFKHDWMTMSVNGMMGTMLLMLVWNLPVFMTLSKPQISNSNDWLFELCISMLLPLIIGFTAPFFWNFYNRKRMRKAFEFVTNELKVQVDTNKYSFDVKTDVEEKITELEDKIALTISKIELRKEMLT